MESEKPNKGTSHTASKFAFVFLGIAVVFILIQSLYHFIPAAPLKGYFEEVKEPEWSFKSWFSGEYQRQSEEAISRNWGFSNSAIRMQNQLNYSLFNKTNIPEGVLIGKTGFLFEETYLEAANGEDYLGDSTLNFIAEELKLLSDSLRSKDKAFLFVIAPNKVLFHSEEIPANRLSLSNKTNRIILTQLLREKEVPYIDFNEEFKRVIKPNFREQDSLQAPIFSSMGIHWSYYAAAVANETIFKAIERQTPRFSVVCDWEASTWREPRGTELDIGNTLNLWLPIKQDFLMAEPQLQLKANTPKANLLVIGDSFYWTLVSQGEASKVYNNNTFWYYNKQEYKTGQLTSRKIPIRDTELTEEIMTNDVVMIVTSDPNLRYTLWSLLDSINFH